MLRWMHRKISDGLAGFALKMFMLVLRSGSIAQSMKTGRLLQSHVMQHLY